jgi:hypothetical protein
MKSKSWMGPRNSFTLLGSAVMPGQSVAKLPETPKSAGTPNGVVAGSWRLHDCCVPVASQ